MSTTPITAGTYTMQEVADLFGVHRQDVYTMPAVMACRIKGNIGRRVRFSKAKIDRLLGMEQAAA